MLNLNPTLTTDGVALFAGQLPGFAVTITHIAFGSQKYDPSGTEKALRAEIARYPIDGGVVVSPSAIQVGVLMTSVDPIGRSPDNQWVGEIGFYVGNTLFAVLSHAPANLFYKSPDIDIPVTYIFDYSVLPPNSITVNNDAQAQNIALASSYAQAAAEVARGAAAAVRASYYGAFSVAPATRPDGTGRQKGDRYYDTADGAEKTFNGSTWYIPNIDAALLAAMGGSGLLGFDPSFAYQPGTVGSTLRGSINVLNHLTPEQIMNSYLRLGNVNCGPQLQIAINLAANKQLIWPAGYIFGTAQELIVRSVQTWVGGGKGKMLSRFAATNTPITELRTCGDGTAYKTVKTRVKYRGSAADPKDDPISAVVNVQSQGFEIRDMCVRINYDEARIQTDPTYLGDNWDVGIFVGCRMHVKILNVAVTGAPRLASTLCDVTRSSTLPELIGWDGIAYPYDNAPGGDGCSITEYMAVGGKWGLLVKGAEPKPGLVTYGRDYKVSLAISLLRNPLPGETLTLGGVTLTMSDGAGSSSTDVLIGADAAETANNIAEACAGLVEDNPVGTNPALEAGLYFSNGNLLTAFRRDINATTFDAAFTASTSEPATFSLSGAAPSNISDPAPYYDEVTGPVADYRGQVGFSDFVVMHSQIYGSDHPTNYARDAIRPDKNHLLDKGGGSMYLDGLAGNNARMIQGHRFFNVRFDGSLDPFNVRLGRTHRDEFIGCHWDGTGTTGYKNPDGSTANIPAGSGKYGIMTRIPKITKKTRLFGADSTPLAAYFKYDDRGTSNLGTGSGNDKAAGNLTLYKGNLCVDKTSERRGSPEVQIYCGVAGSGVIRFKSGNEGQTKAAIRYRTNDGTLALESVGGIRLNFQGGTLEDYRTGTWTPTLEGAAVAGVNSYAYQLGEYEKVGNMVTLVFRVTLLVKDLAMAGAIRIGGLPFPISHLPGNIHVSKLGYYTGFTLTAAEDLVAQASYDVPLGLGLAKVSNTTITTVVAADVSGTATIRGTLTYRAA